MIGVAVGNRLLDAHLEKAARQRDRALEVAVAVLLLLAHVEEERLFTTIELLFDLGRREFGNERSRLVHDLFVSLRHRRHLGTTHFTRAGS